MSMHIIGFWVFIIFHKCTSGENIDHLHYDNSCLQGLDWHATRLSRKLLCNQGTTIVWKYNELIIKMPHQNIL
jgi:hypothetical protein